MHARQDARLPRQARSRWRAGEFAVLYLAAPVAHLAFFDTLGVFPPLAALVAAAVLLLAATPEFRWAELVDVRGLGRWLPLVGAFALVAVLVVGGLTLALVPERQLALPRYQPQLWAGIMVLYPLVSVLGQELLFRPLFFRRYGHLFGSEALAVAANAAVYALAHAFYQNWVAVGLSFVAGLVFAAAYVRSGSFPLVFLLHAIGGQVVFTAGLGVFFYHGAIP